MMPKDGWVCFHCGERFTTPGSAEDHFGARPTDQAACLIKVGEERGLVMELRKVQADVRSLIKALEQLQLTPGCFCQMAIGNPMVSSHSTRCEVGRAVLAKVNSEGATPAVAPGCPGPQDPL